MNLNHVHLHVRDIERSRRFYATHFGFADEKVREEGFLIVGNGEGFDLAFQEDPDPAPMPPWFHIGFRLESREAVRALHDRLVAAGASVPRPPEDHGSWMSLRCLDPDGYNIEVYFE